VWRTPRGTRRTSFSTSSCAHPLSCTPLLESLACTHLLAGTIFLVLTYAHLLACSSLLASSAMHFLARAPLLGPPCLHTPFAHTPLLGPPRTHPSHAPPCLDSLAHTLACTPLLAPPNLHFLACSPLLASSAMHSLACISLLGAPCLNPLARTHPLHTLFARTSLLAHPCLHSYYPPPSFACLQVNSSYEVART
jgi:hypothetical protein